METIQRVETPYATPTGFTTDPEDLAWLVDALGQQAEEVAAAFQMLRRRGVVRLLESTMSSGEMEIAVALGGIRRSLPPEEAEIVDYLLRVERDPRHPHIVRVPSICGGAAVISGTRLPVEAIAGYFHAGKGIWDIQRDYPYLTAEEILDALYFDLDRRRNAGEPLAA